jgi:hypothetical protein
MEDKLADWRALVSYGTPISLGNEGNPAGGIKLFPVLQILILPSSAPASSQAYLEG